MSYEQDDERKDEIEKKELEEQKLRLEIQALERQKKLPYSLAAFQPLITFFAALITILVSVSQFNSKQDAEIKQQKKQAKQQVAQQAAQAERDELIEFKKHFWEKQMDSYIHVSRLAARLSTTKDVTEREKLFSEFLVYYNGETVFFEAEGVRTAMRNVETAYSEYRSDPGTQSAFQSAARDLASACRKEAKESWGEKLKDLQIWSEGDSKPTPTPSLTLSPTPTSKGN